MREDSKELWKLIKLANTLNLGDPLDRQILHGVKNKTLSFEFVEVRGGK